jgi:hypothetical protein
MDIREETGWNRNRLLQNQGLGWIKKRDRFRGEVVYDTIVRSGEFGERV